MMKGSKLRTTAVAAALVASMATGSGRAAEGRTGDNAELEALRARRAAAAESARAARSEGGASFSPMVLTPSRNAAAVATAMTQNPGAIITSSAFDTIPPAGTYEPVAISDVPAAGFPTHGGTFAILTTGDSTLFHTADSSDSDGVPLGGTFFRGDTDYDVTILRVNLSVPAGANCLSFRFRFFSEEYIEYVNTSYNDAFIAELDTSNWTTSGSDIVAPRNFAFDPSGNVISINAAGATSMTAAHAAGTTYDGATPLLTASTPITPGAHALFLSIFDQGDDIYDSAVALDSLQLFTAGAGGCNQGAVAALAVSARTDRPNTNAGSANGYTVTVRNPNATAFSVNSISATLPSGYAYQAGTTTGITTANPAQAGFNLTWTGPFSVPGAGSISLHFNVTTSGSTGVYKLNASAVSSVPDTVGVSPSGPTAVNVLNGVALGRVRDFDRDGKSDATVFHDSGFWYARQSATGSTYSIQFGGSGYRTVAADWDNDGRTDVGVYHQPSGSWFTRGTTTGTTTTTTFGGPGFDPVPGDYDGDGKTDYAVYDFFSGTWYVQQSSTGTPFSFPFGSSGAIPVPADRDGDARTDFTVYYPANGLWYIRSSVTSTTTSLGYGGSGYRPVVGDWNGDGAADVAVYYAAAALWFLRDSSTGQTTTIPFGSSGALPVPSDYDGDGITDPAVYYPNAGGLWYIINSTTGATTSFAFGGPGFNPIEPQY
jgi:hypothetical protein